jgi:hypothetical protein
VPQIIFRTVSGNVIGVVEAPHTIDAKKPLTKQYRVKIGVLDRNGPLPQQDAQKVIAKLLSFVRKLETNKSPRGRRR